MQSVWLRPLVAICAILALMLAMVACGGLSDTTVPPPPNATEIKEGSDAGLDTLIGIGKLGIAEMQKQQATVDRQAFYISSDSVADVVGFYQNEMQKRGWDADSTSNPAEGFLAFASGSNAVVITIIDASAFNDSGTFVMTVNFSY